MREVDRRSKYNRRTFLQGAATAVPTVAIATSAGLGIENAWADDATALTPATLKTLVKVARDIYPHDFLADSYYITAVKPWDGKAAKDPAVKTLIGDGIARLDQDARDRHKVPYAEVAWDPEKHAMVLINGSKDKWSASNGQKANVNEEIKLGRKPFTILFTPQIKGTLGPAVEAAAESDPQP